MRTQDQRIVKEFMDRYVRGLPRLRGFVPGELRGRIRSRLLGRLRGEEPLVNYAPEWATYEHLAAAYDVTFSAWCQAKERRA